MRVHQTWRSLARTVALVLFSSLIFVESISCGGGGGGGITSQQARLGYVLGTDAAAGKTHSLAINSDGTLTPVPGSPFSSTGQPQAVAVSTSSRLAFIASSNGNFVPGFLASFRIGHDGVLSSLGAPVSPGIPIPLTISMPSAGSLLLVGGYGSAWAFAVDTTTGVVNALTSSPAVTFSPDGKFAFGVNGSYMNSYSIDGSTGQATLISSLFDFFELLATPPVVHPSGKFVYVPYESATIIGTPPPPGGIAAYAVATDGTLTPVPGMPFASGINFGTTTGPFISGVIDPSGAHLFAASPQFIYGFNIDQNSGALTQIQGASGFGPNQTHALTFDPSGKYLFASAGVGELWSYSIAADGVPNPISNQPSSIGNEIVSMASVGP